MNNTVNIFTWVGFGIQVGFIALAIWNYMKSKKLLPEWVKDYNTRFDKLVLDTEKWKNEQIERLNLLSKENSTLREENELLRDKLKNLGFTDISLKS